MIQASRFAVLGFSLALAACVQGGGGGKPTAPVSQQQGDAIYSPLATADQADAPGAQAAANQTFQARPTNDNLGSGDGRPAATFQYYFVKAVQAAKPQRVVVARDGASLATAFFAHDVGERLELQAAMNDLLARYPDRHDVNGVLMRGTNRKYVVHVTFVSGGESRDLYYDVSRWVGYTRVHG
jgi:hypothetical protein